MLHLVRTKACSRCGGDLCLERDKYGTYIECIQCGAVWNESELMNLGTTKREPMEGVKTDSDT